MNSISWNQLISDLDRPHLLQTSQWGDVKKRYGWEPHYLTWKEVPGGWEMFSTRNNSNFEGPVAAAGLLLKRSVLPGLSVLYMPKGPLFKNPRDRANWEVLLRDLENYARQQGALQLKIDPDLEIGRGEPGGKEDREIGAGLGFQDVLSQRGWLFSREQIQFRNTVLVDLKADEDELLARMKSKTRYNIRLSGRKGIQIRRGGVDDLDTLYSMYAATSARGGFTIRGEDYYHTVWNTFLNRSGEFDWDPSAQPLIAEYQDQPVAGAVIFSFGDRAWYLHGMSLTDHSKKMPTYRVQWEAMRWAKEIGCTTYDMWGAPDHFQKSDSLWGVYRFKRGFGGEVSRTIGAWDYPAGPIRYRMYTLWMPRLLEIMRQIRDHRTRRISGGNSD